MGKKSIKANPSQVNQTSSERGCQCEDNTYHKDCCDGGMHSQGVGSLVGGGTSVISQNLITRNITNISTI